MKLSEVLRRLARQIDADTTSDSYNNPHFMCGLLNGYVREIRTIADLIDTEDLANPEVKIDEGIIKAKWGDSA